MQTWIHGQNHQILLFCGECIVFSLLFCKPRFQTLVNRFIIFIFVVKILCCRMSSFMKVTSFSSVFSLQSAFYFRTCDRWSVFSLTVLINIVCLVAFPPGSFSLMCVWVVRWDWHSLMSWWWDRNTDGSKNIFWHELIKTRITPLLVFCFISQYFAHSYLHGCTFWNKFAVVAFMYLFMLGYHFYCYWGMAKVYFSLGARNRIMGCCGWMANTAGWDERIRRSIEFKKKVFVHVQWTISATTVAI